jgi:hypothetical protein
MVVVSRYLGGAKSTDDTWLTRFGNWMFTTMANVFFGSKYTDLMVIYRAFRKDICMDLGIRPSKSFNSQLGIRCAKRGLKVAEIPGDEPPRLGGVTKRSILGHGIMELYTSVSEFVFYGR